jgi:hypothetical protein
MSRILALWLLLTACNRVVEQRAYAPDGRLEWSVVMPGSRNTALWLSYVVTGPAQRASLGDEAFLSYDFPGSLNVKADGSIVYQGGISLKPEGIAVDRVYTPAVREDVERTCGYSSCTERGRLKLLQLHDVPAGALLDVLSTLAPKAGEHTLDSATLVLGAN